MYKTENNNFDLIRLLLATIVFVTHAQFMTNHAFFGFVSDIFHLSSKIAVDCFFIVSGFLIFMSYENTKTISSFFTKRLLRIYPGYVFVVLFVAIFAVLISKYSFLDYFSYEWFSYVIANIFTLNFIHPTLPGVFLDNDVKEVNGALWTIKIELMFYMAVPIIGILIKKTNPGIILFIVYILSLIYHEFFIYYGLVDNNSLYLELAKQLPGQLSFFASGAMLFYYFNHFKKYYIFYILLAVLFFVFNTEQNWKGHKVDEMWIFYPFALAFIVIYCATIFKYFGNYGKFGDFSFGIYIWHVPIIQTFIFFNILKVYPTIGLILLISTVLLFASISWRFIEKPFLRKKSHYRVVENKND